jgi:hypothetical protein
MSDLEIQKGRAADSSKLSNDIAVEVVRAW